MIDVLSSVELLRQVAVDPARVDVAEAWIRRRMLSIDDAARRIEQIQEGRMERDARILARATGESA